MINLTTVLELLLANPLLTSSITISTAFYLMLLIPSAQQKTPKALITIPLAAVFGYIFWSMQSEVGIEKYKEISQMKECKSGNADVYGKIRKFIGGKHPEINGAEYMIIRNELLKCQAEKLSGKETPTKEELEKLKDNLKGL